MTKSDSGVMNIKKKVANLKQELDEANDRANNAEATLREKEVAIDKVSLGTWHDSFLRFLIWFIPESCPLGSFMYLSDMI